MESGVAPAAIEVQLVQQLRQVAAVESVHGVVGAVHNAHLRAVGDTLAESLAGGLNA